MAEVADNHELAKLVSQVSRLEVVTANIETKVNCLPSLCTTVERHDERFRAIQEAVQSLPDIRDRLTTVEGGLKTQWWLIAGMGTSIFAIAIAIIESYLRRGGP